MWDKKTLLFLTALFLGYFFYLTQTHKTEPKETINLKNFTKVSLNKKIGTVISPVIKVKEQNAGPTKRIYDDSFMPIDEEGFIVLKEVFINGRDVVALGDILVSTLDEFNDQEGDQTPLRISRPKVWPLAVIPYEISNDLDNPDRILKVLDYYNKNTSIKFIPRNNHQNYLHFRTTLENCFAQLGFIGGKQDVALSPSCGEIEILHEIMHALGFFHEQNREDRNQYLEINWRNIPEEFAINFKKIPNTILTGVDVEFDFESVMLYPPFAFAIIQDEFTMRKVDGELYQINRRGGLSDKDLKKIKFAYQAEIKKRQ